MKEIYWTWFLNLVKNSEIGQLICNSDKKFVIASDRDKVLFFCFFFYIYLTISS